VNRDARAFVRQSKRNRAPDAFRRAGHQDDFAFYAHD
jgi:hypothetical protein